MHAGPRAVAAPTRTALGRLGYTLLTGNSADPVEPDLRIVDERELADAPLAKAEPKMPIVLLTAPASAPASTDSRIVGQLARPASLTPLYNLLPRVPTELSARWISFEHQSVGAILSLSEHGCLMRTLHSGIERGELLKLQFALPGSELVSLSAECVHEAGVDVGLCFEEPTAIEQRAIGDFVSSTLTSGAV